MMGKKPREEMPAPGNLVVALRQKAAGEINRMGDHWGDWICANAADEIERLRAELENCRAEQKVRRFSS